MVTTLEFGGREIGTGQPCFIVAEAGVNHNGDLDMAQQLVEVAGRAGADAVKFQTFKAERLVTLNARKAEYQQQTTGAEESQYDMLHRLELSTEAHQDLIARCREQGILFMSTPFDEKSADVLETLGVPGFKIASGELTNLPFLEHVARKGRPMIVSTGMACLGEVEAAVRAISATGNRRYALLHCVSDYPASPEDVNLRAMHTLQAAFGVPVGYSDHTEGAEVALAAVALGARIIEKHFTLDRSLPGPDHRASLEPDELRHLVQGIRTVEAALGHGRKEPAQREGATAAAARKSLVANRDIPAGAVLTDDLIAVMRPGTGLPPSMRPHVVGRTARVPIPEGSVLMLDMLA